jgi:cytochrome c553
MRAHLAKFSSTAAALIVLGAGLSGAVHAEVPAIANCTWCHGSGAQGYSPAPRLAGQHAAYLREQLLRFRAHGRDAATSRQYMWSAADNLSDGRLRALANYFAALKPKPALDGDTALVTRGNIIYQNGLPDENIVACVACHGPESQGVGMIPRLGGLSYDYLARRLTDWKAGYNFMAATPMPHISGNLSPDQVQALASYLSFIRYAGVSK